MIANFYIDGFNLYYRALKGTRSVGWTCASWSQLCFPATKYDASATLSLY